MHKFAELYTTGNTINVKFLSVRRALTNGIHLAIDIQNGAEILAIHAPLRTDSTCASGH